MDSNDILQPQLPGPGENKRWGQLLGSSVSLAIAQTAKQHNGPLLIITADTLTAYQLEEEIKFFISADKNIRVISFPDWETLPYDNFSPHKDIISDRLSALYRLPTLQKGIFIAPLTTLMHPLPPRDYLEIHTLMLDKQEIIDPHEMRQRLEMNGYRSVTQVMEHGEYALRGSILDLYPMGSNLPYRIELFDQEIETIRTFDPQTQRTVNQVSEIHLLPAREFPLNEEAINLFRNNWRKNFPGDPTQSPIYRDVSEGITPPGVEYYLPLFFSDIQSLFDYIPTRTLIMKVGDLHQAAKKFWEEILERHEQRRHDPHRPLIPPNNFFFQEDLITDRINSYANIDIQNTPISDGPNNSNFSVDLVPESEFQIPTKDPKAIQHFANTLFEKDKRILFCTETAGHRESLLNLLNETNINPTIVDSWESFLKSSDKIGITIAPIHQSTSLNNPNIILLTEFQLFGQKVMQRRRRKDSSQQPDAIIKNLAELNIGAKVVHIDNGIGRYCGLKTLTVGEQQAEYLVLEYANNDILYVPVSTLNRITRYTGPESDDMGLQKLGTDQWERTKTKAAKQIEDVAAELLDVYAQREASKGFAFTVPKIPYQQFCRTFPFEETPDQARAIDQVLSDMQSAKTMDRLICGDVGFGKTEVAMRAAFVAVNNNKQVAILVPTTLLAQQHYDNFKDRFADWPIEIDTISRFRSAKDQANIVERIKAGKVDIIIGTHKLLQETILFKDLGLLIIDEEHRFGVKQKDRIKAMRAHIDILTLTATPIPRTLNMSLSGIRDLSIIATPPARRLSIKTFVREREKPLIKEAMTREIFRGGQVYYLHNQVETIERARNELAELVPEAKISVAHGQMRERELERIMSDFYHHRFNVLVCTTIIETGIDIPTANTIIIDRADKLGLAQLHQLRGRVGRSHHQAYAYLLTPNQKLLSEDAIKRLEAIDAAEELGAGFTLATHDLEIRGAGELLGSEQSGNMHAIGFNLYMEMLEEAVRALKAGETPNIQYAIGQQTEIDLQITALIPEDYLPDVHARLVIYKRIASAKSDEALHDMQVEMIDRFGLLNSSIKNLFRLADIKLKAQNLGLRKIEASYAGGSIYFAEKPKMNLEKLITLVQKNPKTYQFIGTDRLRFVQNLSEPDDRCIFVEALLKEIE